MSKKNKVSETTKEDALKISRGTQKPGQTKEQTKLIAKGIEKGIEQYKKKHKEKTRELDKQLNKLKSRESVTESSTGNKTESVAPEDNVPTSKLPWLLLVLSWISFVVYLYVRKQ